MTEVIEVYMGASCKLDQRLPGPCSEASEATRHTKATCLLVLASIVRVKIAAEKRRCCYQRQGIDIYFL